MSLEDSCVENAAFRNVPDVAHLNQGRLSLGDRIHEHYGWDALKPFRKKDKYPACCIFSRTFSIQPSGVSLSVSKTTSGDNGSS